MTSFRLLDCDAVIFDLDGVVTRTASVHAEAWKQTFDAFLEQRASGGAFEPFEIDSDYPAHVDGKPRYEGVRDFLASRGISIPHGSEDDPPERGTICGIGNRKNMVFLELLRERGPEVFPSTVELIRRLRERGTGIGMVTSSRNGEEVVRGAGISELFDVRLDGRDAARLGLPGKPAPDLFLAAAERLGVAPERAAIVEDARSGVAAGVAGGFALVVGVDRGGAREALEAAGADIVVPDLGALGTEDVVDGGGR